MNPAHRALRDATAAAHERVDSIYGGFDLATRPGYTGFLAAQARALLPLETALDAGPAGQVIDDWPSRRRGALITADLAELGEATGHAGPFSIATVEAAAGTLYVLEGSRLGARMLARQVPTDVPRRFLDADQLSGNWRKLLDRLDSILYEPPALQSAVDAALAAFAAFEQSGRHWLAKG